MTPTDIKPLDTSKGLYTVKNSSKNNVTYNVDITLGVCECPTGIQGRPCKHQAATIKKYQLHALNMVPLTSTLGRQFYAVLALGQRNTQPISFYASLHQKVTEDEAAENGVLFEEKEFSSETKQIESACSESSPSFDSPTSMDTNIGHGATDDNDIDNLGISFQKICNDTISKLESRDENFIQGVKKFCQ